MQTSLQKTQTISLQKTKTRLKKALRGFTLIELGIVLTIISILGLFAVPRVQGFILGGKVTPTATELLYGVNQMRSSAQLVGSYTGVTTKDLALPLRSTSNALVLTFAGVAPNIAGTISHRLGAAPAAATVVVAPVAANDGFTVTFSGVSGAVCSDFVTQVQAQAIAVTVNAISVKSTIVAPLVAYLPSLAQQRCTDTNANTLVFTYQ